MNTDFFMSVPIGFTTDTVSGDQLPVRMDGTTELCSINGEVSTLY